MWPPAPWRRSSSRWRSCVIEVEKPAANDLSILIESAFRFRLGPAHVVEAHRLARAGPEADGLLVHRVELLRPPALHHHALGLPGVLDHRRRPALHPPRPPRRQPHLP